MIAELRKNAMPDLGLKPSEPTLRLAWPLSTTAPTKRRRTRARSTASKRHHTHPWRLSNLHVYTIAFHRRSGKGSYIPLYTSACFTAHPITYSSFYRHVLCYNHDFATPGAPYVNGGHHIMLFSHNTCTITFVFLSLHHTPIYIISLFPSQTVIVF